MTSRLHLTAHAVTRMSQRGIANDDLELIEQIGTEVEGGYVVRERDFRALDRELKLLRDQARRLVGKRLANDTGPILSSDSLVTLAAPSLYVCVRVFSFGSYAILGGR
jgi:hypothetical protein